MKKVIISLMSIMTVFGFALGSGQVSKETSISQEVIQYSEGHTGG